jgi:hypothetical protein
MSWYSDTSSVRDSWYWVGHEFAWVPLGAYVAYSLGILQVWVCYTAAEQVSYEDMRGVTIPFKGSRSGEAISSSTGVSTRGLLPMLAHVGTEAG